MMPWWWKKPLPRTTHRHVSEVEQSERKEKSYDATVSSRFPPLPLGQLWPS
jgi:hypothetical protein